MQGAAGEANTVTLATSHGCYLLDVYEPQPFGAASLRMLFRPAALKRVVRLLFAEPAYNVIIDRIVAPVPLSAFNGLIDTEVLDADVEALRRWKRRLRDDFHSAFQKKVIELYSTYHLLDPRPGDDFMDVAGARFGYLDVLDVRSRFLQDLQIPSDLRRRLGRRVRCIASDAGAIPMRDSSLDKICCHDAFKHFHADSDSRFITEAQRLLRPGGRCAIAQIFVADRYVELTRSFDFKAHFDPRSQYVIDPTATVVACGYVRIYDLQAFCERVLSKIDTTRFRVTLVELHVDGRPAPDLSRPENRQVAGMNRPLRTLLLERVN